MYGFQPLRAGHRVWQATCGHGLTRATATLRHIVRYCQRQSHRCRKQRSDIGWLVRKVRTQDFYPSAERRFLCRVKFRERLNPNPDFIVSFYPSLRPRCGHNHVGYQKCGTLSHIFAICHPPELVRVLLWLSP